MGGQGEERIGNGILPFLIARNSFAVARGLENSVIFTFPRGL